MKILSTTVALSAYLLMGIFVFGILSKAMEMPIAAIGLVMASIAFSCSTAILIKTRGPSPHTNTYSPMVVIPSVG